jgi:PAS domain S-box-containing protein
VDSIPALVWSATPDGAAEFFNQHYLDYVGRSLEEMTGSRWTETVHPDDLAKLGRAREDLRTAGVAGEVEARVRRHDGTYRWFLFRGNPQRDESGAIVKWHAINTDIEDRKRAETLLAGEKQLLEMIASGRSLRDVLDGLCKVVEGVAPECYCDIHLIDWSGPTIAYAVAPSLPQSYTDPIAGTPLRAEVVPCGIAANDNVQVISEDFDTDPRWCTAPVRNHVLDHGLRSVWSTPICSKKGKVLGTLCMYQPKRAVPSAHHQDIIGRATHIASIAIERLEVEDALNKIRSDLAHVTRVMSLGTLAASIAHEVNQPLSGIITNANTCLRMLAADPPNVDGALETARRTIRDGNRAAEVITRLRALFRKAEFAAEQIDIHEAAREVIALSHQEFRRQGVNILTEFGETAVVVTGDRVQLQQVILNLLLNAADALKATDARDRRIVVKTTVRDEVELSVRDNGVGLDPERAAQVFDAFFTTKADGMGIGLSVSKSIIEQHGGRIWAEQNEGSGATFSFSLQLREASI